MLSLQSSRWNIFYNKLRVAQSARFFCWGLAKFPNGSCGKRVVETSWAELLAMFISLSPLHQADCVVHVYSFAVHVILVILALKQASITSFESFLGHASSALCSRVGYKIRSLTGIHSFTLLLMCPRTKKSTLKWPALTFQLHVEKLVLVSWM